MTQTAKRVAVIGAGSWGTAVSGLVARHAEQVQLWAHEPSIAQAINTSHKNPSYICDYELPANVVASSSLEEVLEGAEALMMVTPSAYVRTTARLMKDFVNNDLPICCFAKGIEAESLMTMSQVLADELGCEERIAALSGPNHAEEVSAAKVSAAVIASTSNELAEFIRALIIDKNFRTYTSHDILGVEVCGAEKNVIAIACGVAAGLGQGDNTLAALMTRGLAEISRLVVAAGGESLTCMGLAGMGDLVATCTSAHSRNRSFGVKLAQGITLSEYEAGTRMVVEGARAAQSCLALAQQKGVELPITRAVHDMLYENTTPHEAMAQLLDRNPHKEFYGV